VNLDTEQECKGKRGKKVKVLSAASGCNRMHVVVELEPHIVVASVTTWLMDKSRPQMMRAVCRCNV
jgi:hypothetical protein